MTALAMFPLGTVLLPGQVLTLHIFEPRYQALLRDTLGGDGEFGVVLIERGSEVGGGEVRTDVGTAARIVQTRDAGEGRSLVAVVGQRRIRVDRWLDDDPYPRAEVVEWPDEPATDVDVVQRDHAQRCAELRRLLALCAEVGRAAPPATVELPTDAVTGGFVLGAVAPLGSFDRQRVLAAPGPTERLAVLAELFETQRVLLEADLV